MTNTLQDVQVLLQTYNRTNLTNIESPSPYSQPITALLDILLEYKSELLSLNSNTELDSLSIDYKDNVIALNELINTETIPIIIPTKKKSINDYVFSFVNSNNNLYSFLLSPNLPLNVKNQLYLNRVAYIYNEQEQLIGKGFIRQIENGYIVIETKVIEVTPSYIKFTNDIWSPQDSTSIWLEDASCFIESKISCYLDYRVYVVNKLYSTKWSLYYKLTENDVLVEVAQGIDNIKPGYAFLSRSESLFDVGYYVLRAKQLKYNNTYETNLASIEWKIDSPKACLSNKDV